MLIAKVAVTPFPHISFSQLCRGRSLSATCQRNFERQRPVVQSATTECTWEKHSLFSHICITLFYRSARRIFFQKITTKKAYFTSRLLLLQIIVLGGSNNWDTFSYMGTPSFNFISPIRALLLAVESGVQIP